LLAVEPVEPADLNDEIATNRKRHTMRHMTGSNVPTFALPSRYAALTCLGKGGGGEVWAVRDRITGAQIAFKVLAEEAGEAEILALVREAVTLSGLEGLGVPRVLAFGSLPKSRRHYLVRDLVPGKSLAEVLEHGDGEWLRPLARAADQLTVLHRAGLLHGDIKPANVIVGRDGEGTLVDLGLATPWREGGARVHGLTPKFAAPEILAGNPITVRAEIYALGATLAAALEARGDALDGVMRTALQTVADRSMRHDPSARYPSVDELASALRSKAMLERRAVEDSVAWPVLGGDASAHALFALCQKLEPGEALAVEGPRGAGRTTLVRRLSWSLGVRGTPVANIETPKEGCLSGRALVELQLELDISNQKVASPPGFVVIVDDLDGLDEEARAALRAATGRGARIVAVGDRALVGSVARSHHAAVFEIPPLDDASAREIVKRAIPSLSDKLTAHLLERAERRPGRLRFYVKELGGRAVTSAREIDDILDRTAEPNARLRSRAEGCRELERHLDTGRFDAATIELDALGAPLGDDETTLFAVARSKILLARGDAMGANAVLDTASMSAERSARSGGVRTWQIAKARTLTRLGQFAEAARMAERAALFDEEPDAVSADALAVEGVALAYLGDDARARALIEQAVTIATNVHHARILAVALGSLAIVHQRAGRAADAGRAYESALTAAESAHDAWTIATTRLNLAGLAKAEGDLAQALVHLEAAVDMGQRAGGLVAVQQALFNLANLDLYLGRYARASASMEHLASLGNSLAPSARAQLLGLQAELATRTGSVDRGAQLYEQSAEAYDAVARPLDAAEAHLEGMLARLGIGNLGIDAHEDVAALGHELEALRAKLGAGGFREHEALACIVHGLIALARGDEHAARLALDEALSRAQKADQREWTWRALEARARLASSQGSSALARRDTESALAVLEEIAIKLPRDLREVFWNDSLRNALRQTHSVVLPVLSTSTWSGNARVTDLGSPRSSVSSTGAPLPAEDRLLRIFEITRDLAREHDLERLLERVTDHAVALLGAERGLIVLVNAAGEVMPHTARDNKGDEAAHDFSRSVAARVIERGEPVVATSTSEDEQLARAVSIHKLMIQSVACVPIRGAPPAGRTIGALYLETRLRPGLRFREELPTLAAFADQAAIAIENARLIAENKKRADELAIANEELTVAKDKLAALLGRRTEQLQTARRDLKQVRAELRSHFGYAGLVGTSAAMRRLYAIIDRVKDADVPVLITGESGTGKEVVARAVHVSGERAKEPFLGINCGAIPANLLESELFGHVRGAFTGAERDRKGLFREAERGTLLLDEIGELPMKMQAGLLRVLQERTVRPVGGTKEEACRARIIASTNRDLEKMVAGGAFREDLFYRLHVVEVHIPPLRDRAEDIPALIDHFLTLFSTRHKRERKAVAREAARKLVEYNWPGNVRQLENVLLNAWLLSEGDEITADDLDLPAQAIAAKSKVPLSNTAGAMRARTQTDFRDAERERILLALAQCKWNRAKAAELAGLPRRTFYRRLKEYGIL